MLRNIVQVTETGTQGRYQLRLSCGHDKFLSRQKKPTRKTITCGVCATKAGPRAAALEIERREETR